MTLIPLDKVIFDRISIKWAVIRTLGMGVISSMVIGSWPGFRSWTLTPLLDFENEKILVYFLNFLLAEHRFARSG